jgi:hypothetical protein
MSSFEKELKSDVADSVALALLDEVAATNELWKGQGGMSTHTSVRIES